jgi:pantoate ligase/cytidylate kinase
MRLFSTVAGLHCYLNLVRRAEIQSLTPTVQSTHALAIAEPSLGLIPTMGALHSGHLSLIRQARLENTTVVVSIFVNPLQFGPTEDFEKYPRSLEQDAQLCEQAGVDALFAPPARALGIGSDLCQVTPPAAMTAVLCGRFRPGHFQGVTTIVSKLLHLIQPERAYFGQKDAQQLAIIKRMVTDLNFPVEIVACSTVREENGLALSSRNQYLSPAQKQEAALLYQGLKQAEQAFHNREFSRTALISRVKDHLVLTPSIQLEYIELVDPLTLTPLETVAEQGLLAIAARIGTTRLIDNILLRNRLPIVAIDGPAGAGKSTVARLVAQALNLLYLDTGAMYRAVTWLVLQTKIEPTDEPAIAELVSQSQIDLQPHDTGLRVLINNRDVTSAIRSLEVTAQVSAIAAQSAVRQELVKQQQRYGSKGGIVMEGRDIGTYVFPDAELKIFLTASVQERARRRQLDLKHQGKEDIDLDQLEQAILERDQKDSTRSLAPLRRAIGAIEIQTDGLGIPEVVDQIVQVYNSTCRLTSSPL